MNIDTTRAGRKSVPNLARRYWDADDLGLYGGKMNYFNDETKRMREGDVLARLTRTTDNADEKKEAANYLGPLMSSSCGIRNQMLHDHGIVNERHNRGVPTLQICDLQLQGGSEDHDKCSWKLVQVTKEECKLEIDRSNNNEQGKKMVKFCFATNDTDKLLSCVVDGYKVRYMLRTDAIRLALEFELELSSPNAGPDLDLDSVHGDIKLRILRHGKPYPIILLDDQRPTKKPKIERKSNTFEFSIIGNVPRDLYPFMYLEVKLKDKNGMVDVDDSDRIFSYNFPVDQEAWFYFKGGSIKVKSFWGCNTPGGEGLCTGVCTCEPAEFIAFCSPFKDCRRCSSVSR